MKFTIDLDTLALTEAAKTAKRGDASLFEVTFVRDGIAQDLPENTIITFVAKQVGDFTGDPIVMASDFVRSELGTDAKYLASPSFNSAPLIALFVPAVGAADIAYIDLVAEFSWATAGGLPTSSKTFFIRVDNDVLQGNEGTPVELPTPDAWLAARAQPLSANLTAYASDPALAILNNMPDALSGAGAPVSAASFLGQLYRNTTTGAWYRWSGSAWVEDTGLATNGSNGQALTSNGSGGFGTPVTLGTAATTAATAYATAAQGTDERVPTAAGLTTKFATNDATVVDADRVAIFDSTASFVPKHGLMSAVWTYIKSKIDAGMTIGGIHAFSSTVRPTSAGTGTPAATSLITLSDASELVARDLNINYLNFSSSSASNANGGTSTAGSGAWQLYTSATAGSKTAALFYTAYMLGNTGTISFDRRWILRTRPAGAVRVGLQFYCQIGRGNGASTAAQLDKKGFGYGISGVLVTPFVHNGTAITNGPTFLRDTYPGIILDFQPGVALYVYGVTQFTSTPVLLSTITTGLPTGASASTEGQLEFMIYDTGSGGAANWLYIGQCSLTLI